VAWEIFGERASGACGKERHAAPKEWNWSRVEWSGVWLVLAMIAYHSLWSWEQDFSHGVFCLALPPKGD